jgi:hypothetical protein
MNGSDSDKALDALEKRIPALAASATREAYEHVLQAGLSVLVSDQGVIYEVRPDGSRVEVKRIEKPVAVNRSSRFVIQ